MISNFFLYGSILVSASTMLVAPIVAPSLMELQCATGQETAGMVDQASATPYGQPYAAGLNSMLTQAGNDITDEETAGFYGTLVQSYGLDKASAGPEQGGGLARLVPDIKQIEYQAITLPLSKAGKGITDPEIADFYAKFVRNCGSVKK